MRNLLARKSRCVGLEFSTVAAAGLVGVRFGPDGTLSFLAQDDNSLKRTTITPSPETSIATMLGGSAVAVRQ